ncbi:unnamed protein product, partial [Adineta ricciae]
MMHLILTLKVAKNCGQLRTTSVEVAPRRSRD